MAINTLATATLFQNTLDRTETYYHKKRIVEKDREGSTRESYGTASSVEGESWPASGKVQAQQYGERLNYIRNVRISGKYEVKPDEKGRMHYILENGTDIQESDHIWRKRKEREKSIPDR